MYTRDGEWHVCATHDARGGTMVYLNFIGWEEAGPAPKTLLSTNRLSAS